MPRPPQVKLTAEPPVGAGIILVRQTHDGAFAWATGSTVTGPPALGTAADETVAHLAALEAFLAHPDHAGRRLTLEVADSPGGQAVVEFAAAHLPHIPVTPHPDPRTVGGRMFSDISAALAEAVAARPPAPVRVIAATHGSRQRNRPEGGWAWVTTDGRWCTGDIRHRTALAVEVLAVLRLVMAYPQAASFHIGSTSRPVMVLVHHLRTGEVGAAATMMDLNLKHPGYLTMLETLIHHPAEISFQWAPVNKGYLLSSTAHRLATQARLALQSGMDKSTFTHLQVAIVEEFRQQLPPPASPGRHR